MMNERKDAGNTALKLPHLVIDYLFCELHLY